MPAMTIAFADLPAELQQVPHRDIFALRRAIQRTMQLDAPRWIQWSIRGGGAGGAPARTVKVAPKRAKPGVVKRVLSKLKKSLKLGRARGPKGSGGLKPKAKKQDCSGKGGGGYRQPIDTGDYANSWRSQMLEGGAIFYSSSNPPIKAGVIEHGRRAAPIPIGPLAEWVRRKFNCQDPRKARGIAFAISKAAARAPRPGLKVLERAHPKIAEALVRNVQRELGRSIRAAVAGAALKRT